MGLTHYFVVAYNDTDGFYSDLSVLEAHFPEGVIYSDEKEGYVHITDPDFLGKDGRIHRQLQELIQQTNERKKL